ASIGSIGGVTAGGLGRVPMSSKRLRDYSSRFTGGCAANADGDSDAMPRRLPLHYGAGTRTTHGYSSAIRTQHPDELRGVWLGHEALHLAPASEAGARRRAPSTRGAPRVPVRRA